MALDYQMGGAIEMICRNDTTRTYGEDDRYTVPGTARTLVKRKPGITAAPVATDQCLLCKRNKQA